MVGADARPRRVPAAGAAALPTTRPRPSRTTSRRSARSARCCRTTASTRRSSWPPAGQGSLVGSVVTHDPAVAREVVLGVAPMRTAGSWCWTATTPRESTGHGSPLPVLVHGGPGRAGGGEELGGIRGVLHHMQRTAVQGSPDMLTAIGGRWVTGAPRRDDGVHPFRKSLAELRIGDYGHGRAARGHARGHRALRRVHRRHVLRAHGRGGRRGEPAVRRPRRARLPGRVAGPPGLFVDPDAGPGAGQLRRRQPALPDAGQAGRRS